MGIHSSSQGEYFKDPLIREKTHRVSVWLGHQAEAIMKAANRLEQRISLPPKAYFNVGEIYAKSFHASNLVQNAVFLEMAVFGRFAANNQIAMINAAAREGMMLHGTPANGVFQY